MTPRLKSLQAYPFERLRALLDGAMPAAGKRPIAMSIGEPKHAPPQLVIEALRAHLGTLETYPATLGLPEFRQSVARWLTRRFALSASSVNPETMILPVNGTREALFAIVQAVVDQSKSAAVLMPNPLYLIYEGAALLAGAEPIYLNADAGNKFLPDLDSVPADVWQRCQLLFICSPGNPTGAVASLEYLQHALELADRHDFIVASDECYSEIYLDEAHPPVGLLQAARDRHQFERCLVFHSLSKRSSVPGLRSGFVAGDPKLIKPFLLYRTYHGCAMPTHTQLASIPAWDDESHVVENRRLYREKFAAVLPILQPVMEVGAPDAGFYLWPRVNDDESFARELFAREHVTVVPGRYLARETPPGNPGLGRLRLSLVPSVTDCVEAAERIRAYISSHQ